MPCPHTSGRVVISRIPASGKGREARFDLGPRAQLAPTLTDQIRSREGGQCGEVIGEDRGEWEPEQSAINELSSESGAITDRAGTERKGE